MATKFEPGKLRLQSARALSLRPLEYTAMASEWNYDYAGQINKALHHRATPVKCSPQGEEFERHELWSWRPGCSSVWEVLNWSAYTSMSWWRLKPFPQPKIISWEEMMLQFKLGHIFALEAVCRAASAQWNQRGLALNYTGVRSAIDGGHCVRGGILK